MEPLSFRLHDRFRFTEENPFDSKKKETEVILVAKRFADLVIARTYRVTLPRWTTERTTFQRNYSTGSHEAAGKYHRLVVIVGHVLVRKKQHLVEVCMEMFREKSWNPGPITLYIRDSKDPDTVVREVTFYHEQVARLAKKE